MRTPCDESSSTSKAKACLWMVAFLPLGFKQEQITPVPVDSDASSQRWDHLKWWWWCYGDSVYPGTRGDIRGMKNEHKDIASHMSKHHANSVYQRDQAKEEGVPSRPAEGISNVWPRPCSSSVKNSRCAAEDIDHEWNLGPLLKALDLDDYEDMRTENGESIYRLIVEKLMSADGLLTVRDRVSTEENYPNHRACDLGPLLKALNLDGFEDMRTENGESVCRIIVEKYAYALLQARKCGTVSPQSVFRGLPHGKLGHVPESLTEMELRELLVVQGPNMPLVVDRYLDRASPSMARTRPLRVQLSVYPETSPAPLGCLDAQSMNVVPDHVGRCHLTPTPLGLLRRGTASPIGIGLQELSFLVSAFSLNTGLYTLRRPSARSRVRGSTCR
ncbi:hypothetical protein PG988_004922 [Apiospora saccharicola]